eukprot:435768-Alexandrium_andersonii.AAC.1
MVAWPAGRSGTSCLLGQWASCMQFMVHRSRATVSRAVRHTCACLSRALHAELLRMPGARVP